MTRHTIEASEKPILDILCDKYLFRIPSFQRPYACTTEQTSELLDDLSTACGDAGVWTPDVLKRRQAELIGAVEELWRVK